MTLKTIMCDNCLIAWSMSGYYTRALVVRIKDMRATISVEFIKTIHWHALCYTDIQKIYIHLKCRSVIQCSDSPMVSPLLSVTGSSPTWDTWDTPSFDPVVPATLNPLYSLRHQHSTYPHCSAKCIGRLRVVRFITSSLNSELCACQEHTWSLSRQEDIV